MALLYAATLTPTKIDLLRAWLPTQSWAGPAPAAPAVEAVGAYRFDDPAGEVGVETHLLRVGERILQVPLTYRSAALPDADEWFVGHVAHSVLGERWVYDGCGDPVYRDALAEVIMSGGVQAELILDSGGQRTRREPTTKVTGSGPPPVADPTDRRAEDPAWLEGDSGVALRSATTELMLRRDVRPISAPPRWATLYGTWPTQDEPVLLAVARRIDHTASTSV